jgi:NAD dependent epimerase/dehydratase family enzyme
MRNMNELEIVRNAVSSDGFQSTATYAGYINPTLWNKTVLQFLEKSLVVADKAKVYNDLLGGEGSTLQVTVRTTPISAAAVAESAGVRVVKIRTGLVVSAKGGAWARLLPLFKLGLGGRLGNGRQYWSFISLRDEINAIEYLIENSKISGPVNLTAPNPATNSEVTKAMAKVLRRPALLNVPSFALEIVLGEFSQEVLGSNRVIPKVLLESGFKFSDPDIVSAIKTL